LKNCQQPSSHTADQKGQ